MDRGPTHAISASQCSHLSATARPLTPDRSYSILSQFGLAVVLSGVHSTFGRGVANVVLHRPEKQVGRIDASSNVACVTDQHPLRDRSLVPFVRQAMCAVMDPAIGDMAVSVTSNEIIRRRRSRPQPTRLGLLNTRPEPVLERHGRTRHDCTAFAIRRQQLSQVASPPNVSALGPDARLPHRVSATLGTRVQVRMMCQLRIFTYMVACHTW